MNFTDATRSRVEISAEADLTHNVRPLLHEIRHALQQLSQTGETHVIDLRRIPMAPGEEARILELLGEGEIKATLTVLGRSTIIETAYVGVWIITHYNESDEILGRFIEITDAPAILKSQKEEIALAAAQLFKMLSADQPTKEETRNDSDQS